MSFTVTAVGATVEGETLFAHISTPTPPPPGPAAQRFPGNIDWRFVVLDRSTWKTLTFLDRVAFNRTLYYELNQAAYAAGDVSSDDPEVNILHTDGDPFLSYNDRVLIGLRREGAFSGGRPPYMAVPPFDAYPWVPRFAGLITQVQRQAQADQPVSHYTAFDPLQYWASRPVVTSLGVLPNTDGIVYNDKRGDQILIDVLGNALAAHGSLYVDWGQVAGGAFYGGVIEHTDVIAGAFTVRGGGGSVADAAKQLVDTGTLDFILTPIYDVNRPGILAELSIFKKAGTDRNEAIFAWDKPSRSLSGLDLLHDGSAMGNVAAVWLPTANQFADVVRDNPSVSFYGEWWILSQQFAAPSVGNIHVATAYENLIAHAQIEFQKHGKTTLTITPAPERSPLLFEEYFLGDGVPVYASDDFGEALDAGNDNNGFWSQLQRVTAIPITLSDESVETIESMMMTYTAPAGPITTPRLLQANSTAVITSGIVARFSTRAAVTTPHTIPPVTHPGLAEPMLTGDVAVRTALTARIATQTSRTHP